MGERARFALASAAYAAFVVYGSLVPLDFRSRDLGPALQAFGEIVWLDLGIGSRADWVANVLLFVPLAFLALGSLWRRGAARRIVATAAVVLACAAFSLAIEFAQLFFPPRTVSLNDLLAESIGAIVGVGAWWVVGPGLSAWLRGWASVRGPTRLAERLLAGYLALLFGYALLPLDLTISPAELFGKWREGRVLLIPFAASYPSVAMRAYDLASDVAVWIPAAFLWVVAGRSSARRVLACVLASATALELAQLFVYSRVSDVTDVLTAGIGAMLGILAARAFGARAFGRGGRPHSAAAAVPGAAALTGTPAAAVSRAGRRVGGDAPVLVWIGCTCVWLAVLATVFWYPFDFHTEWGFVHRRIDALARVPFRAYYFGTEFRAVTEVLHKTGFFLPLGVLLGLAARFVQPRAPFPASWVHLAMLMTMVAVSGAIEAGQLLLPAKNADLTDLLLETAGAVLGYVGSIRVARKLERS